ncbi:MAG: O-antigen polymerase [Clostridium baratii]
MKIKRENLIDLLVYAVFWFLYTFDFLNMFIQKTSVLVMITFYIISLLSFYGFVKDKGFLTVNKMIYIFIFLFCYYAPVHQFVNGVNIHNYAPFSDYEYLFANFLIIIFISTYMITWRCYRRSKIFSIKSMNNFYINKRMLFILSMISILCILYLYKNNQLISFVKTNDDGNDSISKIILKIIRFFPVSSLMLLIFSIKDNCLKCGNKLKVFYILILGGISFLIFFPLNGIIGRFLLFGTYIIIASCCFDKNKHSSIILIIAIVGFYYIFPAFNFFKYNSISQISKFVLGGFDPNQIDYDAYQLFMQTIRYVSSSGLVWGINIISAFFNFIPRSIWHGKFLPSGQIIAENFNARFSNVSCPIFAEFYLAFGVIGLVLGTMLFAFVLKIIESEYKKNNYLFKGYYCISVGIIFSYMRGAMLPVSSFWLCLNISYTCAFFICRFMKGKRKIQYTEGERHYEQTE